MSVYVTEYSELLKIDGSVAIAREPAIVNAQKLTPPATSAAFNVATRFIRLHNDATNPISFLVSTAGTAATTGNTRLAGNQTEYFAVNAGDSISVIVNT